MSDKNLEQLIATLKKEAIESSENESKKILDNANQEAQSLKQSAQKEAEQIIENAKKEAEDIVSKGKAVLQQASRDLTLSLQNDILNLCKNILEEKTEANFNEDLFQDVVKKVVASIGDGAAVDVGEEQKKKISEAVLNDISKMKEITLNQSNKSGAGFKITNTSEGWSYDITPENVSEALFAMLTQNWVSILNNKE
jgi:V/A-type H+-transporting ATPase subunit E